MKKKIICSLFSVMLMLVYTITPTSKVWAQESVPSMDFQELIQEELTSEAEDYIKGELNSIRKVIASCEKEFGVKADVAKKLELGKAFVVYDMNKEVQEECVYFPLLDQDNNKIMAIVTLVNTTAGWTYTISREWTEELTTYDYLNKDYLFYQSEGNLIAECQEDKITLNGDEIKDGFDKKTYKEKEKIIAGKMKKWRKINANRNKKPNLEGECGYTPGLKTGSGGYYYCDLYNAQGQGERLTCWAAAVATTVNYRKGTKYTDRDVCKKMGLPERGADFKQVTKALNKYQMEYKHVSKLPEYALLRAEIKKKWPVVLRGTAGSLQHAVTVCGYREEGSNKYISLWDSAINSGKGAITIVKYDRDGIVFFKSNSYLYDVDAASYHAGISYK